MSEVLAPNRRTPILYLAGRDACFWAGRLATADQLREARDELEEFAVRHDAADICSEHMAIVDHFHLFRGRFMPWT